MAASRRRGLLSPFILLRRNSIYKGLLGGERKWLVIGAIVWVPRLLRKALGKNEQVVTTEVLKPGQSLLLTTIPQATKAQRRAAKRTG